MPRFVLLRHDCPADYRDGPHWDLMFEVVSESPSGEDASYLQTWSLSQLPMAWRTGLAHRYPDELFEPRDSVAATLLPPHRVAYLDYEGPLSDHPEQGPRGTVRRDLSGEYRRLEDDTVSNSDWTVDFLSGEFLPGEFLSEDNKGRLCRVVSREKLHWQLIV